MQATELKGEAVRALGEVDALRRRVVNVVGHALRTPVVNLAGLAAALAEADDPAQREELGEAVRRNAHLVEQLLDDLLIAAGVTTVLPILSPAAVDPISVARRWWVEREVDRPLVEEGAGIEVTADPEALTRMLDVVLTNAVRYGTGPVVVTATADGDRVSIAVRSRGEHPPTDTEVSLAFELFYRGEHAVMAAPGLGIGLPVARALAQQAGGDVGLTLESDGTVVAVLELPSA